MLALVGKGASKTVYRASDVWLHRDVAFAVITTDSADETTRARIERERRAMGELGEHPNIVNVYDVIKEGNHTYIISQYMAGGSVADLLKRQRRLPLSRALRVADDVCQALEYAHSKHFVHRDLKPANVWLSDNSHKAVAKLGDFGLVAVSSDAPRLTQPGTVLGTALYMPPEQAKGKPTDARSDIYSLGIMLYEMIAGRPPFLGNNIEAVIAQQLAASPEPPSRFVPALPKELDHLILKLLAKAPEQRPVSAALVSKQLRLISNSLVADRQARAKGDAIDEIVETVAMQRPDLRSHAAADGTIAVFFSDIENSTTMFEKLGDVRAHQQIELHNELVRERLTEYEGHEVKSLGDGFMVVFPSARKALKFAIEIQRAFDQYCEKNPEEPIRVRIGLNFGEAIEQEDDFFGRTVILASRIMSRANGGEIMLSSSLKDIFGGTRDFHFDEGREVELKGLAGHYFVYRLGWRERALICSQCSKPVPNFALDCPVCKARAAAPVTVPEHVASRMPILVCCSDPRVRKYAGQFEGSELWVSLPTEAAVLTFDKPGRALAFAIAMQRQFRHIQIGLHSEHREAPGGKESFTLSPGSKANDAAELMTHAQAGEILASERVRTLLGETPLHFDDTAPLTLELRGGAVKAFRVGWKEKESVCSRCSSVIPIYTSQCEDCRAKSTVERRPPYETSDSHRFGPRAITALRDSGWKGRSAALGFIGAAVLLIWNLRPPPLPAPSVEKLIAAEPAAGPSAEPAAAPSLAAASAAPMPSPAGSEHRARRPEHRLASNPPPARKRQPYSVQVEALMDRAGADKMVSRLKARGYEPYVVETEVDGKTWYRVRVGHYQSEDEADEANLELHRQFPESIPTTH